MPKTEFLSSQSEWNTPDTQGNLQDMQEFEGGEDVNMQNAEWKTEWVFLCTN